MKHYATPQRTHLKNNTGKW